METTLTPKSKLNYGTLTLLVLFVLSGIAAFMPLPHPSATSPEVLNAADVAWMLTATAFVLLMTPGLSFFYGGMVRPKNVISTMLQSFVALGVISLVCCTSWASRWPTATPGTGSLATRSHS